MFCHCVTTSHRTGVFHQMPKTASYTTCSVMETPNLVRYEACLLAVLSLSKTSNCRTYMGGH